MGGKLSLLLWELSRLWTTYKHREYAAWRQVAIAWFCFTRQHGTRAVHCRRFFYTNKRTKSFVGSFSRRESWKL